MQQREGDRETEGKREKLEPLLLAEGTRSPVSVPSCSVTARFSPASLFVLAPTRVHLLLFPPLFGAWLPTPRMRLDFV